jgi:DNA-binding MarR family transcriptional regulator
VPVQTDPRPKSAPLQPGELASRLRIVLGRLFRRLRSQHHFPITHAAVLGRLDRDGPHSTAELAAAEGMRPQSMAQTLSELEAQGLISRRADPADGRRTLLEITAAGRSTLAADRGKREGWLAQALEQRLSERERAVLAEALALLERLAER